MICNIFKNTPFVLVVKRCLALSAVVILTVIYNQVNAQVDSYTSNLSPTSHSPEVSSLAKYIDFPISTYTGQANVSIPIYEVKAGDITLPISLSYHTGGIKVEEIASSVGLGWSLNAGGVIARTVNGKDDFQGSLIYYEPPYYVDRERKIELYNLGANQGGPDSEHDIFNFSFNGYSGKFVRDFMTGRSILFPKQDLLIDVNPSQITITTPEGLKYTFGKAENLSSNLVCHSLFSSEVAYYTNVSWFLTKIESPSSQHFIELNYEPKTLNYDTMGAEIKYEVIFGPLKKDNKCTLVNAVSSWRLSEITTSNGETITFKKGLERCDLDADFMLDEIIVKDQVGVPVKKFGLSYKYLTNNGLLKDLSLYNPNTQNNVEDIRLTLTNVEEFGYDRINQVYLSEDKKHKFEYNRDIGLPSRFSNSQDYWGHYNGIYNETLVPATFFGNQYLEGADRKPDLQHAKQGALSKIIFPTGGNTTFDYGLNECENYSFEYFGSASVINKYYDIGKHDLSETEVVFELGRTSEVDLVLETFTVTPFYVTHPGNKVRFQLFSLNTDNTINEELYDSVDSYTYENSSSNNLDIIEKMTLYKGVKYKLKQTINDMAWAQNQMHFALSVNWNEPSSPIFNGITSGLRVERTNTYDSLTSQSIIKKYVYENGYIPNDVKFEGRLSWVGPNAGEILCLDKAIYTNYRRASVSRKPLTFTNGGIVGYEKVTIFEGENGENGYTVNNYHSINDHPDFLINAQPVGINSFVDPPDRSLFAIEWLPPYALLDSKDWKRGMLKSAAIFGKNNNPKELTTYTYKFYDDPTKSYYDVEDVFGIKVGIESAGECFVPFGGNPPAGFIKHIMGALSVGYYRLQSSRHELESKTQTIYNSNDPTKFVSSTIAYEYDPSNFQMLKSTQINSDGRSFVSENEYATNIPGTTLGADLLRNSHMHSQVLRNEQFVNGAIASKSEIQYNNVLGNIVPVSVTGYPKGGSDNIATNYDYYANGNVKEVSKVDGAPVFYIWGYQEEYPIAKIVNFTTADAVSLQSYIDDAITASDSDTTSALENTLRDKLALLQQNIPAVAQMSYYTYDPLIGVTSMTDPRGQTIYYIYDEFNRLKQVKDQDEHILSENEYNYKQ